MTKLDIAISVVIPAYNQARQLERLLDSLEAQVEVDPFEIIVVDDASPDATGETVARWREGHPEPPLQYLLLEENGGPGQARNRGVAAAQGAIVAFTDTDCVADTHWLGNLARGLAEDASLGGCGGRVEALSKSNATARYNILNQSLVPQRHLTYLVTCNCCYRREALLATEGFTEDLATPGGEDIAASIHVWKRGLRYAYVDEALIYHDFQGGLRKFLRTWRNYGYGCSLIAHRFLTVEEQHPEHFPHDTVENYWRMDLIRPNVMGIRSFFKDLYHYYFTARERGATLPGTLEAMVFRMLDRLAYFYGWRQGLAQFQRELEQ